MRNPALETRQIGRTGLKVPRLCLGTSVLASMPEAYGYGVTEAAAKAMLRAILTGPVRFLDTSRNYGAGRAETWLGDVLRELGGLPRDFVVSTKLDRDPATNRLDAARARRSLQESLEAMGLDRVHILHLHDPEYALSLDEVTRKGGAINELMKMKEEGLAQAIGLAAGRVDVMMPLLRDFDFDVLITHNRYTLLNRNAAAMIDFAHGKGMGVLNAAPFGSGVLAKGAASNARHAYQDLTPGIRSRVRAIEEICARHAVPIGPVALQFSMRDPRITSTITGVSKPERIQQALDWANVPVPEALWEEIAGLAVDTADPEATRDYQPPA
jgi:D-threo-aldose 1-dehydrogenase